MTQAKSFKQMIQAGEVKRADAMKVPLDSIHEEPGFNAREQTPEFWQGIREFAQYIAAGGTYPALEVRPNPAGGVLVVEGHRRRLALRMARDELGAPIDLVNITAFSGNDADRVARIATSQGQVPLTPIELASVYKRLAAFGKTPDEIAAMVHKTRQHVDQLLILANANTDVQNLVKQGAVSGATAVKVVRKHGEGAGQVLQQELGKAKAAGKAKVTEGTIKGKALPAGVTKEVVDTVEYLVGELPTEAVEAVEGVRSGRLDKQHTMVQLPAIAVAELLKTWEQVKEARAKADKRAAAKAANDAQQELNAA